MPAPTYRWTCHNCERINSADIASCAACGFPAIASATEIARARGEPDPAGEGYRALGIGLAWYSLAWSWFWN
jgi:hypothetical protein